MRIQSIGRRVQLPHMVALYVRSDTQGAARLGITVSRRVGKAVQRNRVKRLLREAFRLQKQRFPRGLDLVLIARPAAAGATFHQLFQEMGMICQRVRP